MSKVLIIGGGAAGMMAAVTAAGNGHDVYVYEKNEKLGKKIFITGKGRCNVTNAGTMEELFASVISNPKFLYSAFYGFNNEQTMDFFENLGVRLKIERGNRVFPVSDHSSDIIRGLEKEMERLGVNIFLNSEVSELIINDGEITGLLLKSGKRITADAVIVATGGISYVSTGSTGDGYRFAESSGHRLTECLPSLVPMEVKEWYAKELQGLSLKNVTAAIYDGKKKLYEEFGEMLFTHYGVSGPIIISASSYIGKKLQKKELKLVIDLKPALDPDQLDQRILRDFEKIRTGSLKTRQTDCFRRN